MGKTCTKFQKDRYKIVWGVALTRYPLSQHFHRIWDQKMTKFVKWKKVTKLMQGLHPNHMHISRPWKKHVQSFKKIGVKLYDELSQHFHRLWGQKMTKFPKWKKWQKLMQGLHPNHMHIRIPWIKTCTTFQKDRYNIVWGVALTRYPLSIHWGRKMTKFTKWKKWQKII